MPPAVSQNFGKGLPDPEPEPSYEVARPSLFIIVKVTGPAGV